MAEDAGLIASTTLAAATPRQILATYEQILFELRQRGVVRTNDAPAGQYAEWLAQRALGGTLQTNSVKSFDLLLEDETTKIQVKARVLRAPGVKHRQLSPFRSFGFDQALIVLFDGKCCVARATLLTARQIEDHASWSKHVNGWICIARDELLALGEDATARLKLAEQ